MAREIAFNPKMPGKATRYARALESSPALLDELRDAAAETLSLREELHVARTVLGETVRMLGQTTAQAGVMPQGVARLVLDQIREVNSLVSSCAAIEAKRQDQALDAAKLILLLGRLRDDLRVTLKEAGLVTAVPFVDAAFARAKWTGALDEAAVQDALAAPASFDVKFRPIERGADGKIRESEEVFERPQDALGGGPTQPSGPAGPTKTPDGLAPTAASLTEDDQLKAELAQANAALDREIEDQLADADEAGAPLPGVPLKDKAVDKLLRERG